MSGLKHMGNFKSDDACKSDQERDCHMWKVVKLNLDTWNMCRRQCVKIVVQPFQIAPETSGPDRIKNTVKIRHFRAVNFIENQ